MPWAGLGMPASKGSGKQQGADAGEYGGGGATKLFVGCLPYSKTEADLEPVFSQFGPLVEVAILKDAGGKSKGAGFVTYEDETAAVTAMSYLQGHVLEGSNRGMNISFAQSGGRGVGGGKMPQGARTAPPPPTGPPPASTLKEAAHGGAPGSKIFVGQLPFSRTEADLQQLFGSVGPVVEVVLLKDKKSGEKKGAAFVRFATPQHAAAAAATLNGFLFSGSTRPISVSIAQSDVGIGVPASLGTMAGGGQKRPTFPQQQQQPLGQQFGGGGAPKANAAYQTPESMIETEPGSKLFVGQLPFSRSEDDLKQLFQQYGPVVEVLMHRDAQGQKKGGAFVRFQTAANAAAALDLDGYLFQGSTRPINVAIAGEGAAKRRRMG